MALSASASANFGAPKTGLVKTGPTRLVAMALEEGSKPVNLNYLVAMADSAYTYITVTMVMT